MGKKRKAGESEGGEEPEKSASTIFVRNLPFDATPTQLETVFSEVGPIRQCFIVKDPKTQESRGFGYVHYAIQEDAAKAVEKLNKASFMGRSLKLDFAAPRPSLQERQKKRAEDSEEGAGGAAHSKGAGSGDGHDGKKGEKKREGESVEETSGAEEDKHESKKKKSKGEKEHHEESSTPAVEPKAAPADEKKKEKKDKKKKMEDGDAKEREAAPSTPAAQKESKKKKEKKSEGGQEGEGASAGAAGAAAETKKEKKDEGAKEESKKEGKKKKKPTETSGEAAAHKQSEGGDGESGRAGKGTKRPAEDDASAAKRPKATPSKDAAGGAESKEGEGVEKGDGTKTKAAIPGGKAGKALARQVRKHRKKIIKKLRKMGLEPTEENIVRAVAAPKPPKNKAKYDKTLRAQIKEERKAAIAAGRSPYARREPPHRLIIRNLPFGCANDDLQRAFYRFGKIVELRVARKPDGGDAGFGFMRFASTREASLAVAATNSIRVKGREVAVDWCLPKDMYETYSGGGSSSGTKSTPTTPKGAEKK